MGGDTGHVGGEHRGFLKEVGEVQKDTRMMEG